MYVGFAEICILAFPHIQEGSIVKYLQIHYNTSTNTTHAVITCINICISTAILLSYPLQLFPAMEVSIMCVMQLCCVCIQYTSVLVLYTIILYVYIDTRLICRETIVVLQLQCRCGQYTPRLL